MTQTAHDWMVELVTAAEELGYLVRSVGPDAIALTKPDRPYVDIDIRGRFVNGALLREMLVPADQARGRERTA